MGKGRGRETELMQEGRGKGRFPLQFSRDIVKMPKSDISNGGCWFYEKILSLLHLKMKSTVS